MGPVDHLASIAADGARFADVAATGDLETPVPSCPGWTRRDLAHHLGHIHRWARLAAATAARPADDAVEGPPPDDELAGWLAAGVDDLVATLTALDPASPTWHPFPVPRRAAFWPRRQAHETAVHRWDAEAALGEPGPIEPALAADGVAEYFGVIVPRLVARDRLVVPTEPARVRLADVGAVLHVAATDGAIEVTTTTDDGEPVDADGRAEDVLLAIWARRPLDSRPFSDAGRDWLALGGN